MGRARSVPSKNIPLAVLALSVSSLAALALGGPAAASQLVDRNARNVHLQVNAKGQALITYRASGRLRRVLGWGAINARPSSSGGRRSRSGSTTQAAGARTTGASGRHSQTHAAATTDRCSRTSSPAARRATEATGPCKAGESRCRISGSFPGCRLRRRPG